MRRAPTETSIPIYSRLTLRMAKAHFHDAWSITLPDTPRSAHELFAELVRSTPPWVAQTLRLRNRVAQRLGLKPLGSMADLAKLPTSATWPKANPLHAATGFTLIEHGFDEVLLHGEDQHLSMFFSVHRQAMPGGTCVVLTVSSLVQAHNRLGHGYLRAIQPVHRRIVPAMLARLGQSPVSHVRLPTAQSTN